MKQTLSLPDFLIILHSVQVFRVQQSPSRGNFYFQNSYGGSLSSEMLGHVVCQAIFNIWKGCVAFIFEGSISIRIGIFDYRFERHKTLNFYGSFDKLKKLFI